jgi:prepilin-type N-terminal cleavage/methylation domain-containing protein
MKTPFGFTLLELVVSLAIVGVCLGLVAAAVAPYRQEQSSLVMLAEAARDSAVRTGHVVRMATGSQTEAAFFPDGSATSALLTDGRDSLRTDPWTGEATRGR